MTEHDTITRRYFVSEGALLRFKAPLNTPSLQIYHSGKGWVLYDDLNALDDLFHRAREVTPAQAEDHIRWEETVAKRSK